MKRCTVQGAAHSAEVASATKAGRCTDEPSITWFAFPCSVSRFYVCPAMNIGATGVKLYRGVIQ
jgi:hypothetical protein